MTPFRRPAIVRLACTGVGLRRLMTAAPSLNSKAAGRRLGAGSSPAIPFSGFRHTGIGGTVLRRAVAFCDAGTAGVVSHADRGSRYTLTWLADVAEGLAVLLSAGRTGVCWDNARHESFWPTPKTEFHDRHEFATHAQAIQAVNSCTETVYNHRRPHDTLGQTPSNPRTPNHHHGQPDRSTDIHQTGPTPGTRGAVRSVEPVAGFAALVGVSEDQDHVRLHRVDDAVRGYPRTALLRITVSSSAVVNSGAAFGHWSMSFRASCARLMSARPIPGSCSSYQRTASSNSATAPGCSRWTKVMR